MKTKYIEPNKKLKTAEIILLVLLLLGSVFSFYTGSRKVNGDPGEVTYTGTLEMERDFEEEDYDEDSTVCDVVYRNGEDRMVVSYSYENYEELEDDHITAHVYETEGG